LREYSNDLKNARLGLTNPKHFRRICQSAGSGRGISDLLIFNEYTAGSRKKANKKISCELSTLTLLYHICRIKASDFVNHVIACQVFSGKKQAAC